MSGEAVAAPLRREVARAVERLRREGGPVPTLAVVLDTADPRARRFAALKERAFAAAGMAVRPVPVAAGATTSDVAALVDRLAADPGVHGVLLQDPLPPGVDPFPCRDRIPPGLDVDAAGRAARELLRAGAPAPRPAAAGAVLRILDHLGRGGPGEAVTLVTGPDPAGEPLGWLLERRGAGLVRRRIDAPDLSEAVGRGGVLVALAGAPGAVPGDTLLPGSVVVDGGYHDAGGRGDVELPPEVLARLDAWVPPRGGVGPVVVAELMAATLTAAGVRPLRGPTGG